MRGSLLTLVLPVAISFASRRSDSQHQMRLRSVLVAPRRRNRSWLTVAAPDATPLVAYSRSAICYPFSRCGCTPPIRGSALALVLTLEIPSAPPSAAHPRRTHHDFARSSLLENRSTVRDFDAYIRGTISDTVRDLLPTIAAPSATPFTAPNSSPRISSHV